MERVFEPLVPLFYAFPIGLILFSLGGIFHMRRKRARRAARRRHWQAIECAIRLGEAQAKKGLAH